MNYAVGSTPEALAHDGNIVGAPQSRSIREADHDKPLITFSNVRKSYDGSKHAVDGLNLDIRKGEFLTLLGPSGSGKTTTLMMLAGFEDPSSGRLLLNGEPLTKVPIHKRNFGMVFQNYALFPNMSVYDNIVFPLVERKFSKQDLVARAKDIIELVQLGGLETRRPSQLSGGQQQRVALARALIHDPVLVLMDEPLGALDKNLREQVQVEIKHIHRRLGNTVVFVTHDQTEALTMSDRVAVFSGGQIQQIARPSVIYDRPENGFVASFVGENNILSGIVRSTGIGYASIELEGGILQKSTTATSFSRGDRATVAIRPERLRIGSDSPDFDNAIVGTLREVFFMGEQLRTDIDLPNGQRIVVKDANRGQHLGMVPGSSVTLSYSVNDSWAFKP